MGVNTKHQTLKEVAFPISQEAFQGLEKLNNRQLNYVQLVRKRHIMIMKWLLFWVIVSISLWLIEGLFLVG